MVNVKLELLQVLGNGRFGSFEISSHYCGQNEIRILGDDWPKMRLRLGKWQLLRMAQEGEMADK